MTQLPPSALPRLATAALAIVVAQASMIALAPALADERSASATAVLCFVALALFGGLAWFLAIGPLQGLRPRPAVLVAVFAFGIAQRLAWFGSPAVLDTDTLRYLWDGALSAHGLWPWGPPPAAGVPPELGEASARLHAVLPFAELRTIYPATAQAAFLLAHWIAPWQVLGLRLVMLAAELIGVLMLILVLQRTGQPLMRAGLWWCCPLLPLVLSNAAHVDALLPPLLLAALLAVLAGRGLWAGGLLGLAVGVKVWPVLLAPLLARWLPRGDRLPAGIAFGLVTVTTLAPLLATATASDAGLAAYAQRWLINNAPLAWATAAVGPPVEAALRPMLAVAAGLLAIAMALRAPGAPQVLLGRMMVIAAAVFYLSPAQFPWYAVWFLPFAAALAYPPLLLAAVLLPLYYSFFALRGPLLEPIFTYGIAALHAFGVLALWLWTRLRAGHGP